MSIFKVQCGYPQKTWHYPPVLINEIRHSRILTLLCSGLETRGPSFAITYLRYISSYYNICRALSRSLFRDRIVILSFSASLLHGSKSDTAGPGRAGCICMVLFGYSHARLSFSILTNSFARVWPSLSISIGFVSTAFIPALRHWSRESL